MYMYMYMYMYIIYIDIDAHLGDSYICLNLRHLDSTKHFKNESDPYKNNNTSVLCTGVEKVGV